MTTIQQTDFQHGEILSIGFQPTFWYANVTVRRGRVSELVKVQLSEKEYRQIDGADFEGKEIDPELNQEIINRAKSLAFCFQ